MCRYTIKGFNSKRNKIKLEENLRQTLSVIDKNKFHLQCNLNPMLTYNEVVLKACRKAWDTGL